MAYGTIKADKITYDDGGSDTDVNVSDIVAKANVDGQTFTGNVVLPGTTTGTTQNQSDGSTKLATTLYTDTAVAAVDLSAKADLTGATFTGGINVADDIKITLGNGAGDDYSPGDYEIYSDSGLYIKSNGGHIRNNVAAGASVLLEGPTGSMAKFGEGGACELYYDDVKKFETTSTGVDVSGDLDVSGDITAVDLTLSGDLTVNGTTTTINSTTLKVDDKNIELGTVDTPSDTTADGGGITLKGASDKTITWTNSTDSWDFNQDIKTSGTVTDSKGDVRNIPASTNSTLVAADAGKHISITAGITINASTDFAIGDAVTIFNNQGDGNDETITATGITLYLASDATESGDRTLSGRGVATILCVATDTYVITGAGLS